jgi:hypothetical protein
VSASPVRPLNPHGEVDDVRSDDTTTAEASLAMPSKRPDRFTRAGRETRVAPSMTSGATTRRLNAPQAALVEMHVDGAPRSVNRQQVALVREEWRVVDRWWTEEPVDRRYFDVVLASGENVVVFLDGEAQRWFSQRG